MNLIYNSEQYSVIEYSEDITHEALRFGGYEITDKSVRREWYIGGSLALHFRKEVHELIDKQPSTEEIDAFLGQFDDYMAQSVLLH